MHYKNVLTLNSHGKLLNVQQ